MSKEHKLPSPEELKIIAIEKDHPVPWKSELIHATGRIFVTDSNGSEVPMLRLLSYTILQTQIAAARYNGQH
jgi:hypothetical protein